MNEEQIRADERLKVLKELRGLVLNEVRRVCPGGVAMMDATATALHQVVCGAYQHELRIQGIVGDQQTADPNSNRSRKAAVYALATRVRNCSSMTELTALFGEAESRGLATGYLVRCVNHRITELGIGS